MHYKCEWQNAETKCEISKKSALCCAAINFIFVVQIVGILRFDVGRLAIGGLSFVKISSRVNQQLFL
jgi:hypothetical protein